jgi:hypothetical protein
MHKYKVNDILLSCYKARWKGVVIDLIKNSLDEPCYILVIIEDRNGNSMKRKIKTQLHEYWLKPTTINAEVLDSKKHWL